MHYYLKKTSSASELYRKELQDIKPATAAISDELVAQYELFSMTNADLGCDSD